MKKYLIILLLLPFIATAQQTDTATFRIYPNYIFTCPACGVYPKVLQQKTAALGHAGYKNPDTYGAKGNGIALDDAAIASAFAAAGSNGGVIFTSGKTYLMSKKYQKTLGNTDTIRVWAYGATIKQADLTGNTLFVFQHASGSKGGAVLWFGGKIDGNQFNQTWPYNPHGGQFDTRQFACDDNNNQGFQEAHSCLLAAVGAGLAIFKDVDLVNTVLDGIRVEECQTAIVADGTAQNGAPVHENTESQYSSTPGVCEQGSYWKFRTTPAGDEAAYFINLRATGGSIAIQFSYPDPRDGTTTMPHNTVGVIANCYAWNQAQDNYHIEDCYKNYVYNTTWGADAVGDYMPRFWVSNRTGIASFYKCTTRNGWINFVSAINLQLGFINQCNFVSEYTTGNNKAQYFISKATHVTNSSFTGRASTTQVDAIYAKGNIFSNFNAKALNNVLVADSNTFINGANPIGFASGGKIYRSITTNVTGMPTQTTYTSGVNIPFTSKLYIRNQSNQPIGFIKLDK